MEPVPAEATAAIQYRLGARDTRKSELAVAMLEHEQLRRGESPTLRVQCDWLQLAGTLASLGVVTPQRPRKLILSFVYNGR